MKRLLLLLVLSIWVTNSHFAQSIIQQPEKKSPTSLGLVIYSNDTETVWNALRLANFSKTQGDSVNIFLLGKGVELETLIQESKDIDKEFEVFLNGGGSILGCGTCLKSRNNDEPQLCKFSTLKDLHELIRENNIILTF
ncbi:MAG: DsrE family protein [Candidatus Heimdallarchaeota archaeon]|nr:DsrE family protein [Candidatus Heimdallarchaeota archaeon]